MGTLWPFRYRNGHVFREPANHKPALALRPDARYIIVVGSAEKAQCALFDSNQIMYNRICISVSADQGINQ
jgi:hypothetical protein